jgi:hypothetical protein
VVTKHASAIYYTPGTIFNTDDMERYINDELGRIAAAFRHITDGGLESLKVGDYKGGNYFEIQSDGTVILNGTATTWDDLQGSVLSLEKQGSGLSTNVAENTVDFTTGATLNDYLYDNYQMKHKWMLGSNVHPHIHWEQTQANHPNFLIRYRWQRQGELKTTAWTDLPMTEDAFTYAAGTLNQISSGGAIVPPTGYGLSDILEFQIFRDNSNDSGAFAGADPYTGDASIVFIDIHIEADTLGSNTEFVK